MNNRYLPIYIVFISIIPHTFGLKFKIIQIKLIFLSYIIQLKVRKYLIFFALRFDMNNRHLIFGFFFSYRKTKIKF